MQRLHLAHLLCTNFWYFLIFGCMSEKYVVLVLEWGRWYCGLMPRTGWEERRLTAGRGLVQRLDIGQINYKSWINAFTDILLCEYLKFKWVGQVSEFCSNLKLRFSTLPREQNYKRHIINSIQTDHESGASGMNFAINM